MLGREYIRPSIFELNENLYIHCNFYSIIDVFVVSLSIIYNRFNKVIMMKTIKKAASLKDQIYKLIKDDILDQVYGEDEILNERKISEALNVSRTPVREALKALEAEDWVEYIPYKGIVVKKMDIQDLTALYQVRRVLAQLMVELSMENITPAIGVKLNESLQRQRDIIASENRSIQEFNDADVNFHKILIRNTGNSYLKKLIYELRDRFRCLCLNSLVSGEGRFEEILEEHQAIVEAFIVGDRAKTVEAMLRHIDRIYETAYAYLKG